VGKTTTKSATTDSAAQISANIQQDSTWFRVVGIGASAGGLEAIEGLLSHVSPTSGMAYVIVQHLDPSQKGMLPELLQRITSLKVFLVEDHMKLLPDCVYVIPPNKNMAVSDGFLQLSPPNEPRGLRLPIDFFFRSLANDLSHLSVGIILSGMGSDGSIGLAAIKEKNGIVMVQEPSTAKFESMPNHAIMSVMADIIAPPDELPAQLTHLLQHMPAGKSFLDSEVMDAGAIDEIINLLRFSSGNDFSSYKKNTIFRRIERRMGVHKIEKIPHYSHYLQQNPQEQEILFKELLIGVTSFFRDSKVWEELESTVIPEMLNSTQNASNIRAWVPGCSTGEEAYTLAMILYEAAERLHPAKRFNITIFATDLDIKAIEIARRGVFPESVSADIPPFLFKRFFTKCEEGYSINSKIRGMVVFAQHNIIMDPPFSKIDILSCRNLLIYLEQNLQKKILELFHYCLNDHGVMVLGSSETCGALEHRFTPINGRLKIFEKLSTQDARQKMVVPSFIPAKKKELREQKEEKPPEYSIQSLAENLMVNQFSRPGVLINSNGDILYIFGQTKKYLQPAVGKANLNVFALLRDGLRKEFSSAFSRALREKGNVLLADLTLENHKGGNRINLNIHYLKEPMPLNGYLLVLFSESPGSTLGNGKLSEGTGDEHNPKETDLEAALCDYRDEMQHAIEEMQASQEKLLTTNEELQSANEELQSANEELTSSKEEMQSMNEEMQTLNAELQLKVDDFIRVNNDMKNLLNSTDIATMFLDKDLNIRRYTDQATKLFKLIKTDIGRPFTDQVSDLSYPEMAEDAIKVLNSLIFIQKQIPTKDNRWYSIRIMPYRTFDDRIDGLVITFINITELKQAEEQLHEEKQIQKFIAENGSAIFIRLNEHLQLQRMNPLAEKYFGVKSSDLAGQYFTETFISGKARPRAKKILQKLLSDRMKGKLKTTMLLPEIQIKDIEWSAYVIVSQTGTPSGLILIADAI
jgi:two-component system, chemotaxis family, CheB/CheR fusion protein